MLLAWAKVSTTDLWGVLLSVLPGNSRTDVHPAGSLILAEDGIQLGTVGGFPEGTVLSNNSLEGETQSIYQRIHNGRKKRLTNDFFF